MKRSERTRKKKAVRIPGGKSKVHLMNKKTGKRTCGICRRALHGVPHGKTKCEVGKMAKSTKRPRRAFGGVLCSECTRRVLEYKTRLVSGFIKESEVDLRFKPYVDMLKMVEKGA